eukprot:gnl/MRDRNA2_/MRDRNA2_111551_c0_seq1.p1 gnl/MRDRNA2_/MRDRNA2_111551_c0~~gnl/MRDRNA2_/MRDRNA2_111551_c0_seq1.p1  ORF type:complete len:241 (+),score=27.56 gnl/MRDRNA2_/MRDRNA2_111551_c0_seq1:72-794(+)
MSGPLPWFQHCRSVYAIGRNYAAHAAELNNPVPKAPFWFMKPYSSLIDAASAGAVHRPFPGREESHHELELGVMIGATVTPETVRSCEQVIKEQPDKFLKDFVEGYFVALDMTDRVGQNKVKEEGKPWTQCKGWDTSCPVGRPKSFDGDWRDLKLWLKVNGEIKQSINQRDEDPQNVILVGIPELIAAVARVHTLYRGDLILTGTPKGVGPVRAGDVLEAGIEGHPECDLRVSVGSSSSL